MTRFEKKSFQHRDEAACPFVKTGPGRLFFGPGDYGTRLRSRIFRPKIERNSPPNGRFVTNIPFSVILSWPPPHIGIPLRRNTTNFPHDPAKSFEARQRLVHISRQSVEEVFFAVPDVRDPFRAGLGRRSR